MSRKALGIFFILIEKQNIEILMYFERKYTLYNALNYSHYVLFKRHLKDREKKLK